MLQKKNCAKNCAGQCGNCADEAVKIQQRIFEREVDDELRQEQLAKLWKKYRFVVFGGVIGVILGTIGVEWYQAWREKVSLSESDRYEQAVIQSVQGQTQEALEAFAALTDDGRTGYRYLSQMQIARLLLEGDEPEKGLAVLKTLADDTDAPSALRSVATLSYVGHQIDNDQTTGLRQELTALLKQPKGAFYGMAVELAALIDIRNGQKEQAIALLNTALQSSDLAPQLRERLTLLKGGI